MKMISCFVRERRGYSKEELKSILQCREEEIKSIIYRLKAYGILKSVRGNLKQSDLSDLIDEDINVLDDVTQNDKIIYGFTYVGIIIIERRVIQSYPKYLLSKNEPVAEMKQIIKVLERYRNSSEQNIPMLSGNRENINYNIIGVILFLINDFYTNGIYINSENVIEINGDGEILWDETINNFFPIVKNKRPYYTSLYTEKSKDDEKDYYKRLHECILTECSHQLEEAQLLDIFQILPIDISEESLETFGDKEYILDKLQSEISIQYNTRKQVLLKTLYAYVHQDKKVLGNENSISVYGTNSFHLVWEKVCSCVFNNKLETPIKHLGLKEPIDGDYNKNNSLLEIIDHPKWIGKDTQKESIKTLIPDLVTIYEHEDEEWFIIFDAKYYNLVLEKNKRLSGNPGISDITKQYLYQLAYKDFLEKHNINVIKNCFLMPTEKDEIINIGTVKMDILEGVGLNNILIRMLPADILFDCYLRNSTLHINELMLNEEIGYTYTNKIYNINDRVAENKNEYDE